jgi:hypothetical protein
MRFLRHRFLRHLGAATAAAAIVVALGLAWAHFGAQTLAPGPQIRFKQEIVTVPPDTGPSGTAVAGHGMRGRGIRVGPNGLTVTRAQPFDLGLGSMFDPVNLPILRHTVVIEAGVIAVVVALDVLRRRSRRSWRAAQLAAEEYRADDEP